MAREFCAATTLLFLIVLLGGGTLLVPVYNATLLQVVGTPGACLLLELKAGLCCGKFHSSPNCDRMAILLRMEGSLARL